MCIKNFFSKIFLSCTYKNNFLKIPRYFFFLLPLPSFPLSYCLSSNSNIERSLPDLPQSMSVTPSVSTGIQVKSSAALMKEVWQRRLHLFPLETMPRGRLYGALWRMAEKRLGTSARRGSLPSSKSSWETSLSSWQAISRITSLLFPFLFAKFWIVISRCAGQRKIKLWGMLLFVFSHSLKQGYPGL